MDAMALEYAGFWKRFAATLIDGSILGVILGVPFFMIGSVIAFVGELMGAFLYVGGSATALEMSLRIILSIWVILLLWLYSAVMESSQKQATLGKMALGIKVTDLDGRRITFAKATGRFFAKSLSNITLGIGYIIAAFTQKKQALHDVIAGTLVINRDQV